MDPEFDELKKEFLAEAQLKIEEIRSLLNGSDGPADRERMLYLAHQLKGAGGSYGFQRISTEAAAIETVLEKIDGEPTDDQTGELTSRIGNTVEEIRQRLDELGGA